MTTQKQCTLRWMHCYVIILAMCVYLGHSIMQVKITKSVHCTDLVLAGAHRYRVLGVRSLLECVTHCRPDSDCHAIVFDTDRKLCHLGNARSRENCSNMEPEVGNLRFYEEVKSYSSSETILDTTPQPVPADTGTTTEVNAQMTTESTTNTLTDTDASTVPTETTTFPCQNGGQRDGNGNCVCINSFIGTYCERYMGDCTEGKVSGFYTAHGEYTIHPVLSPQPFTVYCQMLDQATRTFILERNDPAFTFNRTWRDYRDGFDSTLGNHWLGLDKLHLLTSSKLYELRFRIKPGGTPYYSFFKYFVLNDHTTGYTFSIGEHKKSGNLADCMSELQGAKFSTYDADNDDDSATNCAAVFGAGWWYKGSNCSQCNLLGPVLSEDGQRVGVVSEMFWSEFGNTYPFPLTVYLVV